jgi:hypothetical protein
MDFILIHKFILYWIIAKLVGFKFKPNLSDCLFGQNQLIHLIDQTYQIFCYFSLRNFNYLFIIIEVKSINLLDYYYQLDLKKNQN